MEKHKPIIRPEALIERRKYRVRFRQEGGRSEKEMIAVYMGQAGTYLTFSLRPVAGTTRLKPKEITGVWITTEPAAIPRKVGVEKQERRVF